MAARIEKLPLLAKHYSINDGPACFLLLALRLATEFVPGFWDAASPDTPRARGRKKDLDRLHLLRGAVEGLKGHKPSDGRKPTDAENGGRLLAEFLKVMKLGDGVASTDTEAVELIADWQFLCEELDEAATGDKSDAIIKAWSRQKKLGLSGKNARKRRARTLANQLTLARSIHD